MEFDTLTPRVIGCAIEVHRYLGPGLLESAYQKCLLHELKCAKLHCEHEVAVPIRYKGIQLDQGYRIDILVEKILVVELKCVDGIEGIHCAQTLTYMKLGDYPLGLVLNFHVPYLKEGGIRRLVNNYKPENYDKK